MKRHLAAVTSAVLLAGPLTMLDEAPAHAATTCRGKPATIESSAGIVLGTTGDDVIVATGVNVGRVTAGKGNDTVCLVATDSEVLVDLGRGDDVADATASAVGVLVYPGLGSDLVVGNEGEDFVALNHANDEGPDEVRTGGGADRLFVHDVTRVRADLGAGDDVVELDNQPGHRVTGTLDLGDGRDVLVAGGPHRTTADLVRERLRVGAARYRLRGAEDLELGGQLVTVRGTGDDNRFRFYACVAQVRAGGGDDVTLVTSGRIYAFPDLDCRSRSSRQYGQGGDDLLRGGPGDDVLIGGRGEDTARGSGGRDRCAAEHRRQCE